MTDLHSVRIIRLAQEGLQPRSLFPVGAIARIRRDRLTLAEVPTDEVVLMRARTLPTAGIPVNLIVPSTRDRLGRLIKKGGK